MLIVFCCCFFLNNFARSLAPALSGTDNKMVTCKYFSIFESLVCIFLNISFAVFSTVVTKSHTEQLFTRFGTLRE